MMKSTLYSLLVCVLKGLAWAAGPSKGDCLTVRDVCYQLLMLPRNFHDSSDSCESSGGRLAGRKYDFVDIMNTHPAMTDFLRTTNCYWIAWGECISEKMENWRRSSNAISLISGFVLPFFYGQKLCYKNEQWERFLHSSKSENGFVCEYDLPPIQVAPVTEVLARRPYKKTRTFIKVMNSTVIVDDPLFNHKASLHTLCSRLCFESAGCSVFNYNTVSKDCRGFQRANRISTRHHHDWEVWATD